ncbi:hypothetical protein X760_32805 [Mesorhizobium sp. LSHC422A00]|nr:hypothetical protein X762_32115 [Mesorhizobium sp. LSHC426A00]ESX42995.1 hypothetical protein X761_33175 [Mesorhizobium sp. LSHC424B00]ESX48542.1 hypothetical protein X760_32805 [Mesorhizobium sp. LSHC422A00]ESX63860.1 hypothetical protein X758_32670 [Mesorhizobium sp. LSHC416B00]
MTIQRPLRAQLGDPGHIFHAGAELLSDMDDLMLPGEQGI